MNAFDLLFEAALVVPGAVVVAMIVVSLVMAVRRPASGAGMTADTHADMKHAA